MIILVAISPIKNPREYYSDWDNFDGVDGPRGNDIRAETKK